jgi:hypothetical protein
VLNACLLPTAALAATVALLLGQLLAAVQPDRLSPTVFRQHKLTIHAMDAVRSDEHRAIIHGSHNRPLARRKPCAVQLRDVTRCLKCICNQVQPLHAQLQLELSKPLAHHDDAKVHLTPAVGSCTMFQLSR